MNTNTANYTSALITSCDKVTSYQYKVHLSLMMEIQVRRIVDRLSLHDSEEEQATDGDEVMVKDGHTTSKFSKGAMHIECVHDDENWKILTRINAVYDRYVGPESVFPLKNGAAPIMTKFKDNPYSYELLPEYADGLKAMPSVKSINWLEKLLRQRPSEISYARLQWWGGVVILCAYLG